MMYSPGICDGVMAAYKELLLARCGFSFENGREAKLVSAVRRRMTFNALDSPETYLALLVRDGDEFQRLLELLTVNETYFYREEEHLRLFLGHLAPEMLARRNADRPLRIVSVGCSTGEEPYSIAIMLRERFGAASGRLFSITGVDIDTSVIASARRGVYGKKSFRGFDGEIIRRYFEPCEGELFHIRKEIAEQVTFDVVNLLSPAYPPAMHGADAIFYRNVSIYFPGAVQREVFSRLAALLGEEGCLIVGASETIHHDVGILMLMERDGLFFFRNSPSVPLENGRPARNALLRRERHRPFSSRSGHPLSGAGTGPAPRVKRATPAGGGTAVVAPSADVTGMFDETLELVKKGGSDAALLLLGKILGLQPSFVEAHTLKGSILLSLSRFDEARDAAEKALSLDPLRAEAALILGVIARHEDDDDEAVKRFRETIYLSPECWLAHFHMAEMAFGRKEWKRARSAYSRSLELLENGSRADQGMFFSALAVRGDQFLAICRHKLSLLKENG